MSSTTCRARPIRASPCSALVAPRRSPVSLPSSAAPSSCLRAAPMSPPAAKAQARAWSTSTSYTMSVGSPSASSAASVWVALGATPAERERHAPTAPRTSGRRPEGRGRGRRPRRWSPAGMRPAPGPAPGGAPPREAATTALSGEPGCADGSCCAAASSSSASPRRPSPIRASDMIPERAPRLGQDGGALADGGPGGRDEEGQRLVQAARAGQALAQQRVQARPGSRRWSRGAAPPRRRRHAGLSCSPSRQQAPGQEFVVPDRVEVHVEQRVDGRHVGRAAQGVLVVEARARATWTRSLGSVAASASVASSRAACSCRPLHVGRLGRQEAGLESLPARRRPPAPSARSAS